MSIKINLEKLASIIEDELRETRGMCVRTDVRIGAIDGKQIHLSIIADENDFVDSSKWDCVTKEKAGKKTT